MHLVQSKPPGGSQPPAATAPATQAPGQPQGFGGMGMGPGGFPGRDELLRNPQMMDQLMNNPMMVPALPFPSQPFAPDRCVRARACVYSGWVGVGHTGQSDGKSRDHATGEALSVGHPFHRPHSATTASTHPWLTLSLRGSLDDDGQPRGSGDD